MAEGWQEPNLGKLTLPQMIGDLVARRRLSIEASPAAVAELKEAHTALKIIAEEEHWTLPIALQVIGERATRAVIENDSGLAMGYLALQSEFSPTPGDL